MKRRQFLDRLITTTVVAAVANSVAHATANLRPSRILLRSSWQCVNIGDIAHTPGVLALVEKHLPEAEVILWASGNLTAEVAAMEQRRFPKLKIVKGSIRNDGSASNEALATAIEWTDFLLHGSGPSLVAEQDVAAFVQHTKKPFGVYGITYGGVISDDSTKLLSQAEFAFFRDSVSLEYAKQQGVDSPIMQFAPDGAFACDLRDDDKAAAFLAENKLEEEKFLCCLSRLRYTPYWLIPGDQRKRDEKREARNLEMKEQDHAPIRQAIIRVARETDLKILLCPEDMTQMAVGKELLYDRLPDEVKKRVVWKKDFWLTDEALSVYVRSAGLFGSEMHSPIMAVGNGIPAIVCRFAEQTSKGIMWRDVGLGDWLFDLDVEQQAASVPGAVIEMVSNLEASKAKTEAARQFVLAQQQQSMRIVQEQLT
jgi:polysaccharide pyruvyl transferase WcaK-like protein